MFFFSNNPCGFSFPFQESKNRVSPFLGKWKGHSITKRSGVYGATIAEADTMASLEMDDKGQLVQVFISYCTFFCLVTQKKKKKDEHEKNSVKVSHMIQN